MTHLFCAALKICGIADGRIVRALPKWGVKRATRQEIIAFPRLGFALVSSAIVVAGSRHVGRVIGI
jgi:hypothetical protein